MAYTVVTVLRLYLSLTLYYLGGGGGLNEVRNNIDTLLSPYLSSAIFF